MCKMEIIDSYTLSLSCTTQKYKVQYPITLTQSRASEIELSGKNCFYEFQDLYTVSTIIIHLYYNC